VAARGRETKETGFDSTVAEIVDLGKITAIIDGGYRRAGGERGGKTGEADGRMPCAHTIGSKKDGRCIFWFG
jgi:hypothetical protein